MRQAALMTTALTAALFATGLAAQEQANYHTCLFDKTTAAKAEKVGQTDAVYCASRHFDTAPTAFQAQVLMQDLEGMKQRDPKFKAFYDTVRKDSGNDIYTDRQIVLMYIDKREVKKD
jgi:hypothetical protein